SRWVMPMPLGSLADWSGVVCIPNSAPWAGTSGPAGSAGMGSGAVGAGGGVYGTVRPALAGREEAAIASDAATSAAVPMIPQRRFMGAFGEGGVAHHDRARPVSN